MELFSSDAHLGFWYILAFTATIEVAKSRYIQQINETIGERCPNNRLERLTRANNVSCSPAEHYHCLYDSDNQLVESCYEYKQVPKGNYPVFNSYATGNPIDYRTCPLDRYQSWPIKSFETKECSSIKTACSSEGMLICSEGTTTTDRTCKCDYMAGYAMSGGKCCSPSAIMDCFCYIKPCGVGKSLNDEYDCISNAGNISTMAPVSSLVLTTQMPINILNYKHGDNVWYLFLVAALVCFLFTSGIVIMMYQSGYQKKILIPIVLVLIVMILCAVFGLYEKTSIDASQTLNQQIAVTSLAIFVISSCVVGCYIVNSYLIVKKLNFYTEEYEIKVFQLLDAAKRGDIAMLTKLREGNLVDMEDVDYDQRSALHVAAAACQYEAVKYLIDNKLCNIKATDRWNHSALKDAKLLKELVSEEESAKYDEVIKLLEEHDIDETKMSSEQTNASESEKQHFEPHFREKKAIELLNATKKGHKRQLISLKRNKTIMDLSNSSGRTALHEAAENGMENIIKYLIQECEVSPFVWWSDKRPIDCISDSHSQMKKEIKSYMENFISKDEKTKETLGEKTPDIEESTQIVRLLNAASRGDVRKLREFRTSGYNFLLCDYDDRTVLHIAVSDKQEHVVDFLLNDQHLKNNLKDRKDRWGKTPFMIAQETGESIIYYKFLKVFKDYVDTENVEYRTYQLLSAGANGEVKNLERLHKRGVDMNLRNYDGRTALHLAVATGESNAVKFLVQTAKANPNIPDRDNRKAISNMDKEEIENLQKTEIESGEFTKVDKTLLEVMTLASKGKLKDRTKHDERIFYFSMESTDYFKNTPLHVAASKARLEDVDFLLKERAVSPFVRNSFWKTPLQLVEDKIKFWNRRINCLKDHPEQFKLAQERKDQFVNVFETLKNKMEEATKSHVKVDEHFKKYEDKAKVFIFLNRAYRGDILAIRRYILTEHQQMPSLINESDDDGRTALHLAAAEGHYDLVKFLLEQNGITKHPKDRWNVTPLQEAERISNKQIMDLFD